jgi:hypothetical protein
MSGYQLIIADEVFRGQFRKSFEKAEPICPTGSRNTRSTCTERPLLQERADHGAGSEHGFPDRPQPPDLQMPNIFKADARNFTRHAANLPVARLRPWS